MGRQHLIDMCCGVCNQSFDVATEDLEWVHLKDCGETDEDDSMRDYSISQDITCPNCGSKNNVLVTFKGESKMKLDLGTVKIVNFTSLQP